MELIRDYCANLPALPVDHVPCALMKVFLGNTKSTNLLDKQKYLSDYDVSIVNHVE